MATSTKRTGKSDFNGTKTAVKGTCVCVHGSMSNRCQRNDKIFHECFNFSCDALKSVMKSCLGGIGASDSSYVFNADTYTVCTRSKPQHIESGFRLCIIVCSGNHDYLFEIIILYLRAAIHFRMDALEA